MTHLNYTKLMKQIIFHLLLTVLLCSCNQLTNCDKKDIYLIPEGFIGYVYVVYEESNVADLGTRINDIPDNGIYFPQFKQRGLEKNMLCDEFYYLNDKGDRRKIPSPYIGRRENDDYNLPLIARHVDVERFSNGYIVDYIKIGSSDSIFWESIEKLDIEQILVANGNSKQPNSR
jgi:hypothetical protein